eukprot:COSAG01_NODE_58870_length_303_cov_1.019608_1_plen_38_part_10
MQRSVCGTELEINKRCSHVNIEQTQSPRLRLKDSVTID